jgi:hypothetical protein
MINYLNDVVVYEWSADDDMPDNADEFLAWILAKIDLVPPQFRHAAKIDFDAEDDYGLAMLRMRVYYPKSTKAKEAVGE